ncbi:MAG: hydrogenase maturation protease [Anaerolineales bacterium]|nr:hydrogenase maturation protease [Anaerolineales bacterium]
MKTIIIGLGNPILGDDGIGWRVAEQVERQLLSNRRAGASAKDLPGENSSNRIEVECLAVGGLTLMEHLIGYERAILIDAITTRQTPLGTVQNLPLEEIPNRAIGHISSAHDTTLHNAIQVGRSMGAQLPEQIDLVTIEAQQIYDFSDELSPLIAAALPEAVQTVMELLK